MPDRVRAEGIIEIMRQRIVVGEWAPGSSIPRKLELCETFGAAPGTVQKALDQLREEGFLQPRGRLGTFVRENAPHLATIGILFPESFGVSIWIDALADTAQHLTRDGLQIRLYPGCWLDEKDQPSDGLKAAETDLAAGRLAGILLAMTPSRLRASPVITQPGIPRAAITQFSEQKTCRFPCIEIAPGYSKALEWLKAENRRKLGIIATPNWIGQEMDHIQTEAARLGFFTRRTWIQYINHTIALPIRKVTELLFSQPQDRPDALYILDDHLTHAATEGLLDAGLCPEELSIVSHANFPRLQIPSFPVKWLGYDTQDLMTQAVGMVQQLLEGTKAIRNLRITPVFDHELTQEEEAVS